MLTNHRPHPLIDSVLDPLDDTLECLTVTSCDAHILTMQVQPAGVLSRVSLMMNESSIFSSVPSPHAPFDQPTAALDSVPTRLDRLCGSLGDELREVVIAYYHPQWHDANRRAELLEAMRELRDRMPDMAGRERLAFRVRRQQHQFRSFEDAMYRNDDALRHVFGRGGRYWTDIVLDD